MGDKYYPTYKEHRGVAAVVNEALRDPFQRLQPLIAVNDKNMCFDGEIILYSSGDWQKETRKNVIKVQVKATSTNQPKAGKLKYPLYKKDLKIYKQESGVLFFVVYLDDSHNEQIYYNPLTPMDIEDLLQKMKDQASISTVFWQLEEDRLHLICSSLADHQQRQPLLLINHRPKNNESLITEISSLTYDSTSKIANNPFEHAAQVYVKGEEFDRPLGVARLKRSTNANHGKVKTISNEVDNVLIEYEIEKDTTCFKIAQIFSITYVEERHRKHGFYFEFQLLEFKSIQHQLSVLPLITNYFSGESIWIEEIELPGINPNSEKFNEMRQQLQLCWDIIKHAAECFRLLNIPLTTPITSSNLIEIYEDLEFLIDILIYGKFEELNRSYEDKPKSEWEFIYLKVGDQMIALVDRLNQSPRFVDAFSYEDLKKGFQIIEKDTQESSIVSVFSLYPAEKLISFLNLDDLKFQLSIQQPFMDDLNTHFSVNLAVSCIEAYDQTGAAYWLRRARYVFSLHPNYDDKRGLIQLSATEDILLNLQLLQIYFRVGELNEQHKRYLYNVKSTLTDQVELFFVATLLQQCEESKHHLNEMNDADRQEIISSPIYRIFIQNDSSQNSSI